MDYFWYTYIIIIGSVIGSFLNVCIYRIPQKESFVTGRSHCFSCNRQLKFIHMVPVFSFLFLRGRCPYCKARISVQYPLVELMTSVLFFTVVWNHGFTWYSLLACIHLCVLLVAGGIDLAAMIIPNALPLWVLGLGIVHIILQPAFLVTGIIGLFVISVPMLLAALLLGGFGGGDIKLCAACGLFLGYKLALFGFLAACILAAVYGAYLLLVKKASRKTAIPFGPFLASGFILASIWGDTLITWYLSLLS